MQREVFNSDSLQSNEVAVTTISKNDIFAYGTKLIHEGSLGDNPKNKRIVKDGVTYIVKDLRYTDSRGRVFDLMRAFK